METRTMVVYGTGGSGLRKRSGPSTSSEVVGILPEGTPIETLEEQDGWYRVVGESFWVNADYVSLATTQDETPSSARLLGVHELKPGFARRAIASGAKAVTVFNDAAEARTLSLENPDVIVGHRIYFTSLPDPKDMLSRHAIDSTSRNKVWAHGINEYDVPGFGGSPQEILRRAAWDTECAKRLKDLNPDAHWVAGGFPHGCPDFTKPEICDAIRTGYADGYNNDLFDAFNIHNYTKAGPGGPSDFTYYGMEWFETRALMLITKCGFRPDKAGLMAKEAGGELGGGGFKWANYTGSMFTAWATRYVLGMSAPLTYNGTVYSSPFLCSTLFQSGDTGFGNGEWGGYSIADYQDILRQLYITGVAAPREIYQPFGGAEPKHGIIPPRKIIG